VKKYCYFLISLLIIAIDQISKIIVRNTIELGETIFVTKKFFWLTNLENTGAAFSLFSSRSSITRYLFIFITFIALMILAYLVLKVRSKVEKFVYAMILGGAAGNLIDRIIIGKVTDFLWVDFPDFIMPRWPVFNLADSSIVVAISIMFIYTIFFAHKTVEEQ
jgi:signal peptidase II